MTSFPEFWMVLAEGSSETNKRHSTLALATAEASRLARTEPGKRFYVLKSVGAAIMDDPVSWLDADDIPF